MNGHLGMPTIATRTLVLDSNRLAINKWEAQVQTPTYCNLEPKVPWNGATQLAWMEFVFGKGNKKCFRGDAERRRLDRWTLFNPPPRTIAILLFPCRIYWLNASCMDPLANQVNPRTMEEKNGFTFLHAKRKKGGSTPTRNPSKMAEHAQDACVFMHGGRGGHKNRIDSWMHRLMEMHGKTCTSIHLCRHTTLDTKVDVRRRTIMHEERLKLTCIGIRSFRRAEMYFPIRPFNHIDMRSRACMCGQA